MIIDIKGTALDLTPSIKEYIGKKLLPLARFVKRYEKAGEVHLFIEIARTTRHHNKGNVFYAEITMGLPKIVLRAEANNVDIRAAIDNVKDIFKREIGKYKEKQESKR